MQYEIPTKIEEVLNLCQKPIDEELVAVVIAGIVRIAKAEGYSIEQLSQEGRVRLSLTKQQATTLKSTARQASAPKPPRKPS